MELKGEQQIEASQQEVWEALNNPEILKRCIPGCQSLEQSGDAGFDAVVAMKVGPVKAKFKGSVTLSDIVAPNSYTITGEGKGGAAGFAKGGASVSLKSQDDGTLLSYDVDAKVGGKLAQIGSRLIAGTAKKLAEEFFDTFGKVLSGEISLEPEEKEAVESEVTTETEASTIDEEEKKLGFFGKMFKGS